MVEIILDIIITSVLARGRQDLMTEEEKHNVRV